MAITKKRQFEWFSRMLQELQAINFYGEVTITYNNGNMICMKKTQSLKPSESGPNENQDSQQMGPKGITTS